jgi:hypothetical protein
LALITAEQYETMKRTGVSPTKKVLKAGFLPIMTKLYVMMGYAQFSPPILVQRLSPKIMDVRKEKDGKPKRTLYVVKTALLSPSATPGGFGYFLVVPPKVPQEALYRFMIDYMIMPTIAFEKLRFAQGAAMDLQGSADAVYAVDIQQGEPCLLTPQEWKKVRLAINPVVAALAMIGTMIRMSARTNIAKSSWDGTGFVDADTSQMRRKIKNYSKYPKEQRDLVDRHEKDTVAEIEKNGFIDDEVMDTWGLRKSKDRTHVPVYRMRCCVANAKGIVAKHNASLAVKNDEEELNNQVQEAVDAYKIQKAEYEMKDKMRQDNKSKLVSANHYW